MNTTDPRSIWLLAPELTVNQAAILLAGSSPDFDESPQGFVPIFQAIKYAIGNGSLAAELRYPAVKGVKYTLSAGYVGCLEPGGIEKARTEEYFSFSLEEPLAEYWKDKLVFEAEPDWDASTISVGDLRNWLAARGWKDSLFNPEGVADSEDFMDENGEHFAPELALAVAAWSGLRGKSRLHRGVKAAVMDWISSNPDAWKSDEKLSDKAIERIATLVNWRREGGAPKIGE